MGPEDYGNAGDPLLVPSSLIVFRHFKVYNSTLNPMSGNDYRYTTHQANEDGWFTAGCWIGNSPPPLPLSHLDKVPYEDCRCGFYAHYRHDEDFYRDLSWREASLLIAYAAVEVAGKTICGTRGVRAARMRVRALAVEWDKFRAVRERLYEEVYPSFGDGRRYRPIIREVDLPLTDEMQYICRVHMRNTANRLRVPVYENKSQLQAAFPETDMEGLIGHD